jgi:4-alpha-glucanotransferase
MKASELRSLHQLARLEGIQLSYEDMAGRTCEATPETLTALLRALGIPIESADQAADALRERRQSRWRLSLEPVTVAWNGKRSSARVRVPAGSTRRKIPCRLLLENGEELKWTVPPSGLRLARKAALEGAEYFSAELPLPDLPEGYHQLELELPDGSPRSTIIAAPTRSYSAPGAGRQWGAFVPMYAARSETSWGAGNYGDWRELCRQVGALGGEVVGTLPLLAAFLDKPVCDPSPYSPASRLFWNEFYIDIENVPEFAICPEARKHAASPAFQKELRQFRRSSKVDYSREMGARRDVLEILARFFFAHPSERQREFRKFLKIRPELSDYALFRAACDRMKVSWHSWPERARNGKLQKAALRKAPEQSGDPSLYHAYVQWIAQQQMDALLEQCRSSGVKFYLDLPLGVHPDSYDVWRRRDSFCLSASAGAPPDPFFTKGQDWGFAPLHPQNIRIQSYSYPLDILRFQMRHTGLVRIDHVMSLHRLYWIPHGLPPSCGAYVSYPADELYAILCLESHRNQTMLVGENLGTVPPQVNERMTRHGLRRMFVVQYEQRPDPGAALPAPPVQSVASLNTHDMPTFAAHWKGLDISDRAALGLIPRGRINEHRQSRSRSRAALIRFLARKGFLKSSNPNTSAVLRGCLQWLAASPAEILLINLEDLWLEEAPQNVPGTSTERPNWRRKTRLTVGRVFQKPELLRILREVDRIRKLSSGVRH